MNDPVLRLLGWQAMLIQGSPMVYDRLRRLRCHLRPYLSIVIVAQKPETLRTAIVSVVISFPRPSQC